MPFLAQLSAQGTNRESCLSLRAGNTWGPHPPQLPLPPPLAPGPRGSCWTATLPLAPGHPGGLHGRGQEAIILLGGPCYSQRVPCGRHDPGLPLVRVPPPALGEIRSQGRRGSYQGHSRVSAGSWQGQSRILAWSWKDQSWVSAGSTQGGGWVLAGSMCADSRTNTKKMKRRRRRQKYVMCHVAHVTFHLLPDHHSMQLQLV